ncbi:YitT family protein [Nesterenkonia jeotgali]|uniref:Uncharacterized membrane-anchored protein YitT (DUF2179 family) n=1 Tax=Nesterenkonia jeotgali TaxID=317018 RepID=A0A0W8IJZ6_9MICC|nr:YitT family protein [Nesterenkonia jeotgali]KUG60200.1 hypothetical protein AVL63_07200 [Nesterenkonia jeotgali]MBA8920324.1 uncharacterized membrane-anchored protein YitT (DUF2179 family) [Nesterenkonia jeotgali]
MSGSQNVPPWPEDTTIPHSPAEDVFGVLIGTFLASLGLYVLQQSEAVTGGTAGLALLLTYATPLNFSWLFLLVNVPFFALAIWKKGWSFTLKTIAAVAIVSGYALLHSPVLALGELNPLYGVPAGNILIGMGLLAIFRHGASLGGFNIVALVAQERLGLRAGYVQMSLDVVVILLALTVVEPVNVLYSALGAVLLNLVLALNHRPGRYRA